jgi:hypothetical protein
MTVSRASRDVMGRLPSCASLSDCRHTTQLIRFSCDCMNLCSKVGAARSIYVRHRSSYLKVACEEVHRRDKQQMFLNVELVHHHLHPSGEHVM